MGMFSQILLTVDYDRTLTAPDSTVPERNIEAIRWFIREGGAFTVNTGRSIPMARAFMDNIPVSAPLLLYNGSAAYDPEKKEFTAVYPLDLDKNQVVADMKRLFPDLWVEFQGVEAHYLFEKCTDWELFSDHGGCSWAYEDPERIPGPFVKFSLYGDMSGHSVSSMYNATDAELRRMKEVIQILKAHYGDKVEVFHPCPRIIDIHAAGVSKLRAARDLQKAMGRKILICVGDAENDLQMLAGADYAFCPADGIIADRFPNVCKCAEGAVADVIYKKIPEFLGISLDNPGGMC